MLHGHVESRVSSSDWSAGKTTFLANLGVGLASAINHDESKFLDWLQLPLQPAEEPKHLMAHVKEAVCGRQQSVSLLRYISVHACQLSIEDDVMQWPSSTCSC